MDKLIFISIGLGNPLLFLIIILPHQIQHQLWLSTKYKIEKNGEMIKDGKLCSKFRVASIFWPPFALIYWPLGYHPDITYDLVNDVQNCA